MMKDGNSRLDRFSHGIRYRQQRKQVQQIVRRIDKKRSMEIFIERSEGSLIQKEIQNKRKTQIKMQEQLKRSKKKEMLSKRKTFSFNPIGDQIKSQRRHATQSPYKLSEIVDRQKNIIDQKQQKVQHQIMSISYGDSFQYSKKATSQMEFQNIKSIKSIYPNKLGIRPALEELQDYLQEQDHTILERRRRIVQMLVLCLMRRCHKKLYEALDIALETSAFFQEQNRESILKCICLRLIGKIYKEISNIQKKKRISLESKLKQVKTNQKRSKKRHSSFMIKTLASQRVFFTRFAHKYLKSKLLKQTSYLSELQKFIQYGQSQSSGTLDRIKEILQRSDDHLRSINEQNEVIKQQKIITRMNKKLAISLPAPKLLFPLKQKLQPQAQQQQQQPQETKNYKIIIHQRDIESTNKLFPYEYPSCLEKFIDRKEYTLLISSINSVIFSETQCYGFLQVFKEFITHIFGLLFGLIVIMVCLVGFNTDSVIDWILLVFVMVCWGGILFLYVRQNKANIYVTGQRHEKMVKELGKWNKKYQKLDVVFKTTQNCQALIICWPIRQNENIESGSSIQQADSINQDSLSSQEISIELNNYENNVLLNEIEDENYEQDEKDEVILPEFSVKKNKYNETYESEGKHLKQQIVKAFQEGKSQIINEVTDSQSQSQEEDNHFQLSFPWDHNAHEVKSQGQSPLKSTQQMQIHQISFNPNVQTSDQKHSNKNHHNIRPVYHNEITKTIDTKPSPKSKNSRPQLKQIHDIIEIQSFKQTQKPQQFDQQDQQKMVLEMIEMNERKVYDFKYYLTEENQSDSQSVQQQQTPAQLVLPANHGILQTTANGLKNDQKNQQKIRNLLEQQYLWDLAFDSEEEDQVIQSMN